MADERRPPGGASGHPSGGGAHGRAPLRRLFSLWGIYAKMDLMWLLRDPQTVILYLVADAVIGLSAATATFLLAARFDGIGRWSTQQIVFMLGYALVVSGVPDVFFSYNVAYISRRIGRGQLDHILVQPQPIWMALVTDGFAPFTTWMTLAPGVAILVWSISRLGLALTPGWVALLLVNLLASVAIALAFNFLWGSLAFWAPRAAEEINSSTWRLLGRLSPFPLDSVGPALVGGLLVIVPTGFLAWLPTRALLGLAASGAAVWITPASAMVFVALAVVAFRRGLKQYGRTGSQRYLSLGHRS
jgi:ABC-2 type transport system permease protein